MLTEKDYKLLLYLQDGLPICSRPYQELGKLCDLSENEVLERLDFLKQKGFIKRFGVIVKHAKVGYRANAMVVWNIPDESVKIIAQNIIQHSFVTLCYQRPRHQEWNYNLYCMIHGKTRDIVLNQLDELIKNCQLTHFEKQVLFSIHCFKQRGAIYQKIN